MLWKGKFYLIGNFSYEAQNALIESKEQMMKLNHPYIGTEHLILAILSYENVVSNKLKEYKIDYNKFKNELVSIVGIGKTCEDLNIYTPLLKKKSQIRWFL